MNKEFETILQDYLDRADQYKPTELVLSKQEATGALQRAYDLGEGEWISISERLPEDDISLLKSGDFESTEQVLVLTTCYTIMNNSRVKQSVGKKEWVWTVDIFDETITHWRKRPADPVKKIINKS
jgi:hypothetical protein